MTTPSIPEVWLRGPVPGYEPLLMPVVHALLQAREDIEQLAAAVPQEAVWKRRGGAASVAFHVQHMAGSLDRLFTYARGEELSDEQRAALRAESREAERNFHDVVAGATATIDRALAQLRATSRDSLLDSRKVGRAGLPSNVLGLLVHAAEHTTRHVGQALTTAKIVGAG